MLLEFNRPILDTFSFHFVISFVFSVKGPTQISLGNRIAVYLSYNANISMQYCFRPGDRIFLRDCTLQIDRS